MSSDHVSALFYELFSGLPRLGPGNSRSTRRALAHVRELTAHSRVLDIGCGTGSQTFVLAESTQAHVVAIDNHPSYVGDLNRRANDLDISDRVVARVADMRELEFPDESFDLIWCEGAIYNMGVEAALQDWRRFLKRPGWIAFTEVCWLKPNPPIECERFWQREYPSIRSRDALLAVIALYRYDLVGNFELNASAWWDEYYRPLQRKLRVFRERYREDRDAQALCDQCQFEIDIWHSFREFYGYEFFVLQPE